jgi:hypothetical protein
MASQYPSCFLLVQRLITQLATFADIPTAGSGPTFMHMIGKEEKTKQAWLFPTCVSCNDALIALSVNFESNE